MMDLLRNLLVSIIGLSGGVVVGTGLVAFLVVLDIVPRLAQLSGSYRNIRSYEWALILGATFFTFYDFFTNPFPLFGSHFLLILVGSFFGIFVGLLAAALTEVINVIPILTKRIRLEEYIQFFLFAMAMGKMTGSLIDWFFFYKPGGK